MRHLPANREEPIQLLWHPEPELPEGWEQGRRRKIRTFEAVPFEVACRRIRALIRSRTGTAVAVAYSNVAVQTRRTVEWMVIGWAPSDGREALEAVMANMAEPGETVLQWRCSGPYEVGSGSVVSIRYGSCDRAAPTSGWLVHLS